MKSFPMLQWKSLRGLFWWARDVVCVVGRGFPTLLFVASWRAQRFCHSKLASPTVSWANPTLALIVPAPLTPFYKFVELTK